MQKIQNKNYKPLSPNEMPYQVSEIDIVYVNKVHPSTLPQINHSGNSVDILRQYWNPDKINLVEQFKVMYLNRANKVMYMQLVSTGGISGTTTEIRHVLATAIRINAVSIILAHNHPSGNTQPSSADHELSENIKTAAKYHFIKVLDNIILTSDNYYSHADEHTL